MRMGAISWVPGLGLGAQRDTSSPVGATPVAPVDVPPEMVQPEEAEGNFVRAWPWFCRLCVARRESDPAAYSFPVCE